ncbi:MAG: sigma-70 family RNA polymerase sigma factor [Bacteroidota bacterium]
MKQRSSEEIVNGLRSTSQVEVNDTMHYLYERMYPTVQKLILNNKGNQEEVPDVFQDGLVILYKLALQGKIDQDTKVEGYLYSICRNLWLKELKKKKRTTSLTEEMQAIPVEDLSIKYYISGEQKVLFEKLLSQLGDDCYQLLTHFYFEKRRMKEIVELMDFSSEQVAKNKKSKCMKKLRELIEKYKIKRDFFY